MATIKVRATLPAGKVGYYNLRRYRDGQVFDMEMDVYHPADKSHPCSWVEPVEGYEVNQASGQVEVVTKKKAKAPKKSEE